MPAAAVATGLVEGVPVGVQVIAARFREDLCLDAAEVIERGAGRLSARLWARESLAGSLNYGWQELKGLRYGRWKLIDSEDPEVYDLEADPFHGRAPFRGRQRRIDPLDHQVGDALLVAQDRPARRLGRVRREYRVDGGLGQQPQDAVRIHAGRLEPEQAVTDAPGLRPIAAALVGPTAPDPVDLLGQVDDLEPGRKRADQVARVLGCPVAGPDHEFHGRLRFAVAAADRGDPVRLHLLQQLLAPLVLQDLTHQSTQRMDVVRGKVDVLSQAHGESAAERRPRCCAIIADGRGRSPGTVAPTTQPAVGAVRDTLAHGALLRLPFRGPLRKFTIAVQHVSCRCDGAPTQRMIGASGIVYSLFPLWSEGYSFMFSRSTRFTVLAASVAGILAAAQATRLLLTDSPETDSRWTQLLGVFAVTFVSLGTLVFEFLTEE